MSDEGGQMPASLARWFAAAVPFVHGASDVQALQRALGDAHEPERLALTPTFVRWQARNAMHTLYARLAAIWTEPGAFSRAVDRHLHSARATTGQPWSIGAGFAEALEADGTAPSWAAEMADLAWATQVLRTTNVPFDRARQAIDPRLVVRFYAFALDGTERSPSAWLLFRSDETEVVVRERASIDDIALAGELAGEQHGHTLAPEARERSLEKLRALGLCGERG